MDRLVDVFGRFYLVLDKKKDDQDYEESSNPAHIFFELKVINERNNRAKVLGSLTNDHMNLELVYGDQLLLHPEEKNKKYPNDVSTDMLVTDPETIQTEVAMFHPGNIRSGHTICRGRLALVANSSLLHFLKNNATRNRRSEAQKNRHKKMKITDTGVEDMIELTDHIETDLYANNLWDGGE
jgi:hypothetical protein